MTIRPILTSLLGVLAAACTHKVTVDDITVRDATAFSSGVDVTDRRSVAYETCEAQYEQGRQNYLAAVEARIGVFGMPDATRAPLDAFRAEINAAYNAVVQRCKTHMHCLEVQRYEEAKCYIAASDRKDAERRFADLAEDLRRIEGPSERKPSRTADRKKKKKPAPQITINNTYAPSNTQIQNNDIDTDADAEARIEETDILAICGDSRNLLRAECRKPCRSRDCRN